MITLTLKEPPNVPLEAEMLSPDVMAALANDEIRALPVYLGKRQRRLDDFFSIEGEKSDELDIRGDVGKVKWIGRGMTRGRITVASSVGMHLGAHMKGGSIDVSGNAADWAGAEMRGGLLRIRGAAIGGLVRDFAGLQMKGGTIVLRSGAELRTGAWMVRGTIISLKPIKLLPTFSYASTYNPTFLRLYGRHLGALGFTLPYEDGDGAYQRYAGDACVPGKGEILVWKPPATSP